MSRDLEVLPTNVNFSDTKPMAVKSYVRRFKNPSENIGAVYTAGNEIRIPIDTGTPGAFLDQKQSYLEFQVTITNTNNFIDYANLTSAGFGAVIRRFALQVNGTDCEVIEDYNKVFELLNDLDGECRDEFSLYTSSKYTDFLYSAAGGSFQLNNVKLPMVDFSGRIMYAADFNANYASGYGVSGASVGNEAGLIEFTAANALFRGPISSPVTNISAYRNTDTFNILAYPDVTPICPSLTNTYDNAALRIQDRLTYYKNVRCIPIGVKSIINLNQPNGVGGATLTTFAGVNGPSAYGVISGALPTAFATTNFNPGSFTVTVELPILSGIVGALCEKLLPTFLMGTVEMVLTLEQDCKVFSVSMDPCRRLYGTTRDYLPYHPLQERAPRNTAFSTTAANKVTAYPDGSGFGNVSPNQFLPSLYSYIPPNTLLPQYVHTTTVPPGFVNLGVTVGNNNANAAANAYAIGYDTDAAYGTFLPASVPQSWRCFLNGITGNAFTAANYAQASSYNLDPTQQKTPTYTLQNVYYVAQQIILPDAVTAEIIETSAKTDLAILTSTYKTYTANLQQNSGDQSIMIPAKIAEANSLFVFFQTTPMINTGNATTTFLYDSLTRICPIGYKGYTTTPAMYIGSSTQPTLYNIPVLNTGGNIFSFQLRIGNDLLPAQPMSTIPELICEIEKAVHGIYNKACTPALYSPLTYVTSQSTTAQNAPQSYAAYDITKAGFCTTWIDANYLNDQTIINNWSSVPAQVTANAYAGPNYSSWQSQVGVDAAAIPYNATGEEYDITPYAATSTVNIPVGSFMETEFFTPQRGYFFIGFDLDTWSGYSNVSMSGRYLGNNNVSLDCRGLNLAQYTTTTIQSTAVINCTMRMSFQAGGNFQTFY